MPKITNSIRNAVKRRAANCCERCGVKIRRGKNGLHNGSIHHRLPRRLGGPDWITNLILLCLECHREIHRDEASAAAFGWIVWGDPDLTPLLRQGRGKGPGWVLLVPDGGLEYLTHEEGARLCAFVNGTAQVAQGA